MVSSMKRIIINVDVEDDLPTYLENSYLGLEEGLPELLRGFKKYNLIADFFVTGDVCKKYKEKIKKVVDEGHHLGCHGMKHESLCLKGYLEQYKELLKATETIENTIGIRPEMFRAPNFSANGDTIKALDKIGYAIDSSVLPNRVVKKFRVLPIIDFRDAPKRPYHPSYNDICEHGDAAVLEIPLVENPRLRGAPLGLGYLNTCGVERTISAIASTDTEYVTFLIHPWECVNLAEKAPQIPEPWHRACRNDMNGLIELFEKLKRKFEFSTLSEIGALYER